MYKNKFRNFESFQKGIRKIKVNEWADWIKIGKNWFTIEEYDSEGRYMRITSLTAQSHIDINTSNSYSLTWLKDAELEEYKADRDYRFYPD